MLRLNLAELDQKLASAFGETASHFNDALREEIESVKWEWPRETQRRNGDVASSPRDIVDTEELKNSQRLVTDVVEFVTYYYWGVNHAQIAHEGATLKNGTFLPGRPWTTAASQTFDFEGVFSGAFEQSEG